MTQSHGKRDRACEEKLRYATKGDAVAARDNARRRRGLKFQVYHCRWCSGFHLASPSKSRSKRRQR